MDRAHAGVNPRASLVRGESLGANVAQSVTRYRQTLLVVGVALIALAGVLFLIAGQHARGWPFLAVGAALIVVAVVTARRGVAAARSSTDSRDR